MALVEKSFEEMLEEIEFEKFVRYDIVGPEKFSCSSIDYTEEIVNKLEIPDNLRTPLEGIIHEVISNIHEHAHKQDRLNMSLKVAEGKNGYVLRFRDSGEGFDYKEVIRKLREGEKYSSHECGGVGLAVLEIYNLEASFEDKGNVLNIKVMKGVKR